MKRITTIPELIEALGGDTLVADMLGISQSAVAHWKLRNQIASGWHMRLLSEAIDRGYRVEKSVFGLAEHEAEKLFAMLYREPRAAASNTAA
jgi:predicted transcriptional regulator